MPWVQYKQQHGNTIRSLRLRLWMGGVRGDKTYPTCDRSKKQPTNVEAFARMVEAVGCDLVLLSRLIFFTLRYYANPGVMINPPDIPQMGNRILDFYSRFFEQRSKVNMSTCAATPRMSILPAARSGRNRVCRSDELPVPRKKECTVPASMSA